MNIRTVLSVALAVIAASATAAQPGRFTISGHVTGVPDSTVLDLCRADGRLLRTIATDTIIGGRIHFSDGRPGLAGRYGAFSIPHYVLIAPDGTVMAKWSGYGPGSLHRQLSELLK